MTNTKRDTPRLDHLEDAIDIAYSEACRPVIPIYADHPFRCDVDHFLGIFGMSGRHGSE